MTITRRFDGQQPLVTDPEVRGAALVLSPDALAAWLSRTLGTPCTVVPRRLHHQPGTGILVGFDLTTARDGHRLTQACVARADADRPGPETAGLLATVTPEQVLAHDPALAVLVTGAGGDRALPLLPVLFGPDGLATVLRDVLPSHRCSGTPRVETLRHDPERGWVGVLEHDDGDPLLLRAHRDSTAVDVTAAAYAEVGHAAVRTPRLLGTSSRLACTAEGFAVGQRLSASTSPADWYAAGAGLAQLHDCTGLRLPTVEPEADGTALEAVTGRLAAMLPDRAADVTELGQVVSRILERIPRDRVALHGGFSPDRVVVGPDALPTLVDLGSARLGPSAADVGPLAAAAMVDAEAAGMAPRGRREVHAFLDGYTSVRRGPDPFAVGVHTVASRLRTALDPFLNCAPDWRQQVDRRIDGAWAALDEVCVVGRLR